MPRPDVYAAICPSRGVLATIGDKWTSLVLGRLASEPVRFGMLRRSIDARRPTPDGRGSSGLA